ncbi:MAG: hypothetical protein J7M40_12375 [Planctomycetes bacterium]|nr:hypothetical protein [Planctomycetota bacterium]
MKPSILIRFTLSLVVVIFASPVLAGDWQEFAVSPSLDNQEKPDVHGEKIVWQQLVEYEGVWAWDIYLTDLGAEPITATDITPWEYDQQCPAIYGNSVVWEDNTEADWDFLLTDITDPADPILHYVGYLSGNQRNPAISGNTVVWQDDSWGAFDIAGADVTALISGADQETPEAAYFWVTALEALRQEQPAIYRNTVVWQDDYYNDDNHNWDILSADIWRQNNPIENVVSYTESDKEVPAVWGDIVVWREQDGDYWDIWAADISDVDWPIEFPVSVSQTVLSQTNPDVGDNLIVWQDKRNGNWDIYGYNLTTGQEFQITDNDADQKNPAVSGNLVVWQDNRDEYPDFPDIYNIYAVELSGPEVARCDIKPAGDTNGDCRTDLRDLSTIGQTWLNCGLDIAEACWN